MKSKTQVCSCHAYLIASQRSYSCRSSKVQKLIHGITSLLCLCGNRQKKHQRNNDLNESYAHSYSIKRQK